MGNIVDFEKYRRLKSLKDLQNDVKIMNDIFNDEGFISEIQCILSIEIAPESEKLINKLLYKIKGDIKFHLNITKDMGAETLVIGLKAFCQLYEMAVNYSLGMSNIKSQVKKKPSVNEERKDMWASSMKEKGNNHFNLAEEEIRPRRNSLKGDEENLCAICFDKQIQIMLPCLHGFCEECCVGWYTKKSKTECPMCRTPIGEGDWNDKIFTVITKASNKEGRNDAINKIAAFINFRANTLFV